MSKELEKEYLEDILNKVFDYGVQSTLDNLLIRGYNTKNMLEQVCLGNSLRKDLNEAKTNITNLSTIKQALQRLESIDNANPSEALKCFDTIKEENCCEDNSIGVIYYDECNTIKQALLKAQEQEKVLSILKEKCLTNCNLALVKDNVHYENYCKEFEYFLNKYNESPNGFEITKEDLLTQEEFELLKQYFEKNIQKCMFNS